MTLFGREQGCEFFYLDHTSPYQKTEKLLVSYRPSLKKPFAFFWWVREAIAQKSIRLQGRIPQREFWHTLIELLPHVLHLRCVLPKSQYVMQLHGAHAHIHQALQNC